MSETGNSFLMFKTSRREDLRRISRATRGEYSEPDLHGEAWLIADKISEKRGSAVDLSDPEDQEIVLRWLYNEVVRYTEKNIRHAVRLDRDWDLDDSESAESRLALLLAPHEWLDQPDMGGIEEKHAAILEIVRYSYSQYSAYMILLKRFEWDVISLAEHLRLLANTAARRVTESKGHMKRQPSLFDRIEIVEYDFVPMVARGVIRVQVQDFFTQQLGWDFA